MFPDVGGMRISLDPEFNYARTVPDCSLETLVNVVFPALHWFCKADRIYIRYNDKWYLWAAKKEP